MSSARNGQSQNGSTSNRRLRFDDFGSIIAQQVSSSSALAEAGALSEGHSGRRFVLIAGALFILTAGVLYLVFHEWKARYRRRADYGTARVVPAIDPMATIVPPGVDPDAWRDAIKETHAMLATVVRSNLLDMADMDRLRAEIVERVERARTEPAAARDELASIWNELADRAEFVFQDSRSPTGARHTRPKILPPRPPRPRAAQSSPGG